MKWKNKYDFIKRKNSKIIGLIKLQYIFKYNVFYIFSEF